MIDDFDVPSKGLDKMPEKKKTFPVELEKVEVPVKPEPDVDLDADDLLPVVEKELSNSLLETMKSGWGIKQTIGLSLTLITFISLFLIGKCT